MSDLKSCVAPKLGSRFRALRQYHEMSGLELSLRLGCSRSSVWEFEIGENAMPVPKLIECAWHLGVPPELLLRGLVDPETLLRILGKPEKRRIRPSVVAELFRFADEPENQGNHVELPPVLRKNSGAQAHPHAEAAG